MHVGLEGRMSIQNVGDLRQKRLERVGQMDVRPRDVPEDEVLE